MCSFGGETIFSTMNVLFFRGNHLFHNVCACFFRKAIFFIMKLLDFLENHISHNEFACFGNCFYNAFAGLWKNTFPTMNVLVFCEQYFVNEFVVFVENIFFGMDVLFWGGTHIFHYAFAVFGGGNYIFTMNVLVFWKPKFFTLHVLFWGGEPCFPP